MTKTELASNIRDMMLCWSMLDRMEEEGECLVWTGATQGGQKGGAGYPVIFRQGRFQLARRVMLEMCGRRVAPKLPVMTTCGNRDCVNPAHLRQVTCADVAKQAAARGAFSTVARSTAITVARRRGAHLKLTIEKVREIRLSEETAEVLSLRMNVHKSTVNAVRQGRIWRELPGQNPWAGLMQRAA